MHREHKNKQSEHEERQKGKGNMLRNYAEKGRHGHKSDVCERHLNADHRLRIFLAEHVGGHMYYAGINGRTTKTDYNKSDKCEHGIKGYKQEADTKENDTAAESDEEAVG